MSNRIIPSNTYNKDRSDKFLEAGIIINRFANINNTIAKYMYISPFKVRHFS